MSTGFVAPLLALAAAGLAGAGVALLLPARRVRSRPLSRVLGAVGGRLARGRGGAPSDLTDRIAAAGRPGGLGAWELMAIKGVGAIAGGFLGLLLSALAPGRLGPLVAAAMPVAAFLAPDLWLHRRAADRARAVRRALPAMLDLLRVTVEAGASLPAALESVGRRSEGPLADEWRGVGREVAVGVPLGEALTDMTGRLPQAEVRSLVSALERSLRHGAPPAETLAAQARAARFDLRRRVREDAARAGPKMQLVVALLLVPSVLLLVAAALAAALLDGSSDVLPI